MILYRMTRNSLFSRICSIITIFAFLFLQVGCPLNPKPPTVEVVSPSPGIFDMDRETATAVVTFTEGGSAINPESFVAENLTDDSGLFTATESGAQGLIPLYPGMNFISFSVDDSDGTTGTDFTVVYQQSPELPQIDGNITKMTPGEFDGMIQETPSASVAVAELSERLGLDPHKFHEAFRMDFTPKDTGHSLTGFWARMAKAEPPENEEISVIHYHLPESMTGGQIDGEFTFMIRGNHVEKYIAADSVGGWSWRLDYESLDDPTTWTEQYLLDGNPVDVDELARKGGDYTDACVAAENKLNVAVVIAALGFVAAIAITSPLGVPAGLLLTRLAVQIVPLVYMVYDAYSDYMVACCGPMDSGNSSGDPHLFTIDGLSYDNQLRGEFVLSRSTPDGAVEVQTRQQRVEGWNPCTTGNTAMAVKLGGNVVEYRGRTDEILVNGTVVLAEDGTLDLGGGGRVIRDHGVTGSRVLMGVGFR